VQVLPSCQRSPPTIERIRPLAAGMLAAPLGGMDQKDLRDRSMRFAVRTVKFCQNLPDSWFARRVGGQLLDAATSVAMNYRSATRGRSRAEFIAKLGISVEEADESVGWLELMTAVSLGRPEELRWLLSESRELLAILSASQKTAKENRQRDSNS
jgi:four helix bundle protein